MNENFFKKFVTAGALGLASFGAMSDVNAAQVEKMVQTQPVTHIVKSGESLSKIAKKYSVSIQKIASANKIKDVNNIKVGMKLTIPIVKPEIKKASVKAGKPVDKKEPVKNISGYSVEPEVVDSLVIFMMSVENSKNNKKGGWNPKLKRWFPHVSFEGGEPTIGYGHKMLDLENYSKYYAGLTDEEVMELLKKDISAHIAKAAKEYESLSGKKWNDLLPEAKALIIEKVYNIGTIASKKTGKYYPKLAKALAANDVNGILANYTVVQPKSRNPKIKTLLVDPLIKKIKNIQKKG